MNFMTDSEEIDALQERRIGHLNLWVADLERARDFYCDVLGLTVSSYGPDFGLPTVFLAFGNYHHHIALNWYCGDAGDARRPGRGGLNHFAILYPDEASLAKAVSRVLEHGVSTDDARDHGGTLSVYLRDPDGNGIELYYDKPRACWFDSAGHLVIKAEPFNVKQWLKDAMGCSLEAAAQPMSDQLLVAMQ